LDGGWRRETERGGDDQQNAGEFKSQSILVGTDALKSKRHFARVTQALPDENVQRCDDHNWNYGDQSAVDCVHDKIRKLVRFAPATDLYANNPYMD